MKITTLAISLAAAILPAFAFGTEVTYSDTWNVISDALLVSTKTGNGGASSYVDNTLHLNYFDSSLGNLTGVKIVYTFNAMTLSGTLSTPSGAVVTSATAGLTTFIKSTDLADGVAYPFNLIFDSGKTITKTSTASGFSLTSSDKRTLNVSRSLTNFTALNSADPNDLSFFTQAGTFALSQRTQVSMDYNLDSGLLDLTTMGQDTGTVNVTYTYTAAVVPEPATLALIAGGVGMLVIGQRIRRHIS